MKAFLLYRDRDFDWEQALPLQEPELTQDLALDTLVGAMARGNKLLREVARRVVMSSLRDPQEIVYRQHILADCLEHPSVVQEIYDLAAAAIDGERKVWGAWSHYAEGVLHRALEVMELFVGLLRRVRDLATEHAGEFHSEGFATFFATLQRELDDAYFERIASHLTRLHFRHGMLISARLGKGNRGTDYVLRTPPVAARGWRQWIPFGEDSPLTLVIADRDESGLKALSELRDRGIAHAASALSQSVDHILSFFTMVRAELGFYLGCLNLHRQLVERGEPVSFPVPTPAGAPMLTCRGLYDVGLSLSRPGNVVGNDVDADGKRLIIVTGANQGGKSTFLRSLGLAQLMMQCGMFVGAESFRADVQAAVYTHYRREEDPTMTSGKLDEELSRMRVIADAVTRDCLVLFNESFSATNEREGAEIADAIVRALLEADIKVAFVTHAYELAHGFFEQSLDTALFLRAERRADGSRTFRVVEGEPLPTSFGADLYRCIFTEAGAPTGREHAAASRDPDGMLS